jgi:hypothetical protein
LKFSDYLLLVFPKYSRRPAISTKLDQQNAGHLPVCWNEEGDFL